MNLTEKFHHDHEGKRVDDPGPCDVWCEAGKDNPGDTVYCRNHRVLFVAPNPCPLGRGAQQKSKQY